MRQFKLYLFKATAFHAPEKSQNKPHVGYPKLLTIVKDTSADFPTVIKKTSIERGH
jgi:hypothetical protein